MLKWLFFDSLGAFKREAAYANLQVQGVKIRFTKRSDSKDFLNTTIKKENHFFHTINTACAKKVVF